MEREYCTDAAPAPSFAGPAAICTVTCTTLMTVPRNSAIRPSEADRSMGRNCGEKSAIVVSPSTTKTRPQDGMMAVRPVRLTMRPVMSEPTPMPTVMGTSSRPVSPAEASCTTRR